MQIHAENSHSSIFKDKVDLDALDREIISRCERLKECCGRGDEESIETAAEMAAQLAEWDNWLLRYIELECGGTDKEEYFKNIEAWEHRISMIPRGKARMLLGSLREILINRYRETGDTDGLIAMLEKHTAGTDAAVHFSGMDVSEEGGRRCTNNTMALLELLLERGDRTRAEKIISEIGGPADNAGSWCNPGGYGMDKNIRLRYMILLEKYGYLEEAARWRENTAAQYGLTESGIKCEICYLKGEYEEALRSCGSDEEVREMLEYIVSGKLPGDIDQDHLTVLDMKPSDSVHCRGFHADEETQKAIQLTNGEWHRFYADMETLADLFDRGLRSGAYAGIYPPDYYKAELSYDPEPPVIRGDCIEYLYKNGTCKGWLGLT